jgi:DNA-binding transcriptional LysR family regulator
MGETGAQKMTFHQLRIFKTVAEHLSVTRAAHALHLSQPCVSAQLKLLECEFHMQFYRKKGQGIKMTDEGLHFLKRIRPIVQQMEELPKLIAAKAGRETSILEISATQHVASAVLSKVLVEFRKTYPDVVFSLKSALSEAVEQMVINEEAEMGIVINPSYAYGAQLFTQPFSFEEAVAVVSCNHALAKKGELSPEELSTTPALVWKAGVIAKEVRKIGLTLNVTMECDSTEALKAAVESGLGLGFFYRNTVESNLRSGTFKRILISGVKALAIRSYIVYPIRRTLSPHALEFMSLLHQHAPKFEDFAENG